MSSQLWEIGTQLLLKSRKDYSEKKYFPLSMAKQEIDIFAL